VEDELLERVAPLRHDEQPAGDAAGGKDFLDRAPAGDELLVGAQELRGWQRLARTQPWSGRWTRAWPGTLVGRALGSAGRSWTGWAAVAKGRAPRSAIPRRPAAGRRAPRAAVVGRSAARWSERPIVAWVASPARSRTGFVKVPSSRGGRTAA
jgi:hypothetical protein